MPTTSKKKHLDCYKKYYTWKKTSRPIRVYEVGMKLNTIVAHDEPL